MRSVLLEEENFPNYRLYEDGRIENVKTKEIKKGGGKSGTEHQLWKHNKRFCISSEILRCKYFNNELQRPGVKRVSLDPIGVANYVLYEDGRIGNLNTYKLLNNYGEKGFHFAERVK